MNRTLAVLFCAVTFMPTASAQNPSFDPQTGLLTLPVLESGGTTYTDVVVHLVNVTVVGLGGSFPTLHAAIGTTSSGGLTWTDASTTAYTWSEANAYCNMTKFNGLGGWRLPSRTETINSPSQGDAWTNQPYVDSLTPKESKHYVTATIKATGATSHAVKIFSDYQPNYAVCVRSP